MIHLDPTDFPMAALELGAAWLQVKNIKALLRDKEIKGVFWGQTAFYLGWGVWNVFFYPLHGLWLSGVAGLAITIANAVWLHLAIKYRGGYLRLLGDIKGSFACLN